MYYQRTYSLQEIIDDQGADVAQQYLSDSFSCAKNPDIEYFLHRNAVRFEQAKAAKTFLVFEPKSKQFVAYFSLSFKTIEVKSVSKNRLKRLTGGLTNSNRINVYLIAQVGKNTLITDNPIKLNDILTLVLLKIKSAQSIVGGRTLILECENNDKLISHYEKHGFSLLETTDESNLKTMFIIPEI